ncbi:hypothetical protein [Parapusillimonas granuli]|uniref:hypothetical protein n=1 Tax=Parapusillimonas granuli TaxID=380911 RepID=UPI0017DD045A|nr:hypothetical protein [Parapusillimonas granuli]MBB5215747.1 DNA-binding NtrC family response regulator [Parapusillimonas granuli]
MRERLDCALLSTRSSQDWASQWLGRHAGGKLLVHSFDVIDETEPDEAARALASSAIQLRRYDVCLLPVLEHNLSWARTALATARGCLYTPVLALVLDLKAGALNDLYALGLADFVRGPVCLEELRARVERLLDDRRRGPLAAAGPPTPPQLGEFPGHYAEALDPDAVDATEDVCANILDYTGLQLEAFAVSVAFRCSDSPESFRSAKSKVVERFERAYLTAALDRHSGNNAMAARAAQKHRRAFWALMRKHEIDAAPFRPPPASCESSPSTQ